MIISLKWSIYYFNNNTWYKYTYIAEKQIINSRKLRIHR